MLLFWGQRFSPGSLFAAGEQGAWYDPSDFSTQYQDSVGTTPVTAVTQAVGLLLDKRLGAARGANIGTTSINLASGGWTANAGVVTAAGTAGASDFVEFDLSQSTGVGETYVLTLPNTMPGAGFYVNFLTAADATSSNQAGNLSSSTTGAILTTTAVSTQLRVGRWSGSPTGTIGPITVRQISGNHATQATGGSRPILQQVVGYAEKGDGLDDFLASATGGGGTAGFFFCAAINPSALGANQTLWADTGTNTGYRVRLNATNNLELSAGNGTAFTTIASVATVTSGTTYVVTAWHDGVNLNCQINLGAIASTAFGTTTAGTSSFTLGASNGGASGFFNGYTFSEVYRKDSGLTSAQRAQVQQYIAGKAGISI